MMKAKFKKLNKKLLFVVFGAAGALLTVIRFYQMFALTDPSTGFFTDKSNVTVPLYYVLWFFVVIGSLLLFYASPDCETGAFHVRKNPSLALGSVVMAAGVTYDFVLRFAEFRELSAAFSLGQYLRAQKAYISFAGLIMEALAAVVLLVDAVACFRGAKFIRQLKFCHLLPVLWLFCTTVGYFSITVSYLNVTQLMLMIFADGFLMVFAFEYARFLSDIEANESSWLLFASGVIAEVLLCAALLPCFVMTLGGKTELLVENCPVKYYELTAIVFIPAVLFTAASNKNYAPIRLDPADAPEDDETPASAEDIPPFFSDETPDDGEK